MKLHALFEVIGSFIVLGAIIIIFVVGMAIIADAIFYCAQSLGKF